MGVYIPYIRLPSTYQEVEYIQSSGTQYFVVGTSFKTSYKSVIDFQMTQTGGDQVIIGFNFSPYRYGINAYSNNFKVITGSSSGWSNTVSENTNRHTIIIDKSTATVDGNNYTISGYTNATVNGGIGVFAHNYNGVGNYFASVKIYNLEIYNENGTLIYHLVPCYRKSDTVIGMYDIVNKTFYTNSGSGTFTKGPDVYMSELKNAYIGDAEPSWTLFTESNFASSSYGDKLFRRSESWSAASFGTRDTYPVLYINSGSHYSNNILLNSSNHTTLNSHKYIKEVIDYIAFEPTGNTYGGGVGISELERFRYAYGQRYEGTYSTRATFIPTSGQGYKIEQTIDTSNMSCTIKFIKLSDNTETTLNYTKQYESFTEGYAYGHIARDQSCNSWLGNIHLYYAD